MEDVQLPVSGIRMQLHFVDEQHEKDLIKTFQALEWPDRRGRRSLHWGYTFSYKTFGIDHDTPYKPFPTWLEPLLPQTEGRPPDQVCLQHYPPGSGIPPHVDTHSVFDQLYALSLGSPVIMDFREGKGPRVEVDLPSRSMMQMSGDSRLHWTHGIRSRMTDTLPDGTVRPRGERWSITYRWLRDGGVCDCGNVAVCDTAQSQAGVETQYRWKQQTQEPAASQKSEPVDQTP